MDKKVRFTAKTAVVCGVYIVLTLCFGAISYGPVQFRISELLILLCFIDPRYAFGITAGCVISNMFSPFGAVDALFGGIHTLVSVLLIIFTEKRIKGRALSLFISSLWAGIMSFIIAFETVFITGAEQGFFFWYGFVALGEFGVVTVIGFPIYRLILKNKRLTELLKF